MANRTAVAPRGASSISIAMITGVSRMRSDVLAARNRAERMLLMLATRPTTWPTLAGERGGGRSPRLIQRDGAQSVLDLGDAAGGHAQLADAEPREHDGRLRLASQLAAYADPAPVGVCRLDGRGDQAQHRHLRAGKQGRQRLVAALGGHRVLREVVGADREE